MLWVCFKDMCVRCVGQHPAHKVVDLLCKKVAPAKVADPFISRTRSEAMHDEAGHALASFRRTASASAAKTACKKMDRQASALRISLSSIDSTMSRATAIMAEASRLIRDWFKGLAGDELHRKIEEAFSTFDLDGGGSLDKEEFSKAYARMGKHLNAEEIDVLFSQYDADGNGTIDNDEFRHMVLMHLDQPCRSECGPCNVGPICNQRKAAPADSSCKQGCTPQAEEPSSHLRPGASSPAEPDQVTHQVPLHKEGSGYEGKEALGGLETDTAAESSSGLTSISQALEILDRMQAETSAAMPSCVSPSAAAMPRMPGGTSAQGDAYSSKESLNPVTNVPDGILVTSVAFEARDRFPGPDAEGGFVAPWILDGSDPTKAPSPCDSCKRTASDPVKRTPRRTKAEDPAPSCDPMPNLALDLSIKADDQALSDASLVAAAVSSLNAAAARAANETPARAGINALVKGRLDVLGNGLPREKANARLPTPHPLKQPTKLGFKQQQAPPPGRSASLSHIPPLPPVVGPKERRRGAPPGAHAEPQYQGRPIYQLQDPNNTSDHIGHAQASQMKTLNGWTRAYGKQKAQEQKVVCDLTWKHMPSDKLLNDGLPLRMPFCTSKQSHRPTRGWRPLTRSPTRGAALPVQPAEFSYQKPSRRIEEWSTFNRTLSAP